MDCEAAGHLLNSYYTHMGTRGFSLLSPPRRGEQAGWLARNWIGWWRVGEGFMVAQPWSTAVQQETVKTALSYDHGE